MCCSSFGCLSFRFGAGGLRQIYWLLWQLCFQGFDMGPSAGHPTRALTNSVHGILSKKESQPMPHFMLTVLGDCRRDGAWGRCHWDLSLCNDFVGGMKTGAMELHL